MPRPDDKVLDVITIGRASVDLYGQQIGSRLEDIALVREVGRRLSRQHRHRHRPDLASSLR